MGKYQTIGRDSLVLMIVARLSVVVVLVDKCWQHATRPFPLADRKMFGVRNEAATAGDVEGVESLHAIESDKLIVYLYIFF